MNAHPSADTLMLDADAVNAFLLRAFPHMQEERRGKVVALRPGHARLHMASDDTSLRPGGIVSGPKQMGFADAAAYAVILAHIGLVAMAVTTALNFQFLRPARPGLQTADASLLRLGRRLAVVDVRLWTDDEDKPVGQANVTYAIP